MKKIAIISAILIGGLFTKTANAQVGINVRAHFGSGNGYYPAAHIAVAAPVYRQEAPVYYSDRNDYRGYRGEEQRFDRDREYSRVSEDRRGNESRGYQRGSNGYGEQRSYNSDRGGHENHRR